MTLIHRAIGILAVVLVGLPVIAWRLVTALIPVTEEKPDAR